MDSLGFRLPVRTPVESLWRSIAAVWARWSQFVAGIAKEPGGASEWDGP